MDIERVHPQLRKAYARFPVPPVYYRPVLWLMKKMLHRVPVPKIDSDVSVTEQRLSQASVRVYRPLGELSGAGFLWIHGGGYVIGNALINDRECAVYAKNLKAIVVSVDYRLAPESAFPLPLDDCLEAWEWLQKNAEGLGVDPERIAIGGQSAGGGLTAALAQRLHDQGGVQPRGQLLFCPMIDDRTATDISLDDVKHRLWNNRCNRAAWGHYLGMPAGSADVPPYAAPSRRQDLSGLPPAWLGVGSIDLFHDEDCLYAKRLQEAGVDCELVVVPDAPHAFESIAAKAEISQSYNRSAEDFLRSVLNI